MADFRKYQIDADNAITNELASNNSCIVKMFCGTGKSRIMRHGKFTLNKPFKVYVFYSLALICQFSSDYCCGQNKLIISSDVGENTTTDPVIIRDFLQKNPNEALILITYQSFNLLLDNLDSRKISLCCFDEAHHIVGNNIQSLVFPIDQSINPLIQKQIFFTATPINANGIIMFDRDNMNQGGMCGNLVYDYSYLDGTQEEYLNPFEIRLDFYTDNSTWSIFESIARSILSTGNSRGLTFHSDVNTERDTSVNNFVDQDLFVDAFNKITENEFPEKRGYYKNIKMVALTAEHTPARRTKILSELDGCPDNEVYLISSCNTIGEGIDTKNANLCVFVDSKTSYVQIIQNIGRIVRRIKGSNRPNSTILLPCFVDRNRYIEVGDDHEKQDKIIREDMCQSGNNFNVILNVMAALKQEDEELYDICLKYQNKYSPREIMSNLQKHGLEIDEDGGKDYLSDIIDNQLPDDSSSNGSNDTSTVNDDINYENDEDYLQKTSQMYNNVSIELHNQSLEEPIRRYGTSCAQKIIRVYQSDEDENGQIVYYPIYDINNEYKKRNDPCKNPNRLRFSMTVHSNDELKILWKLCGEVDLLQNISSCVIDCEVVKYDPMETAQYIINRANKRESLSQNKLPRQIKNKNRTTAELEQEYKDASKLHNWKMALKGKGRYKCPDSVIKLLDYKLSGWRDELDLEANALRSANKIIERSQERELLGQHKLPRKIQNKKNRTTSELEQEYKDAVKLGDWKRVLKGQGRSKCPESVVVLLDKELSGWRDDSEANALRSASEIIERSQERELLGQNKLPRYINNKKKTTAELEQENKDANKLGDWKKALKGKGKGSGSKCPESVVVLLDKELSGWREDVYSEANALRSANEIIERSQGRVLLGQHKLPRQIANKKNRTTAELEQEYKDAHKLNNWKMALKGKGNRKSPESVVVLLDKELSGWRDDSEANALQFANEIIERSRDRELLGQHKLPRNIKSKKNRATVELEQEYKDACKLNGWKQALKGKGPNKCPESVVVLLDKELSGWRNEVNLIPPSCNKRKSVELITPHNNKLQEQATKKRRELPPISSLHQKYKTITSQNLNQLFNDNNGQLWHEYHEIAEANDQTFNAEDLPRNKIIVQLNKICSAQTIQVADLGCGKAHILAHFHTNKQYQVYSYDHYSDNSDVIQCDINAVPLLNYTMDIVVLSLAMWGSNCSNYVMEANRILKTHGTLYIAEATRRWSKVDDNGQMVGEPGQRLFELLETSGFIIIHKEINKFCICKCIKLTN